MMKPWEISKVLQKVHVWGNLYLYVCQHGEPPDVLQDVHPDTDVPNPLGDGTPTKEEEKRFF